MVLIADERRDKSYEVTFCQSSTSADADEEYTHRATSIWGKNIAYVQKSLI